MKTRNRISCAFLVIALIATAVAVHIVVNPVESVSAAGPPVRGLNFMASPLANTPATEVIASGLNNPRGLNFGPEGALYVAEAGSGGPGLCAEGPEGPRCYGTTASITRIDVRAGAITHVATGLPSLAVADGSFAIGAHDISFQGRG